MSSATQTHSASPFDPRTVLALLVFGALAFFAALYFIGAGKTGGEENDGGGHAASRGLTGYAALADLLEARGEEVSLVRNAARLSDADLLVLTPPHSVDGKELAAIVERRRHAGPTIVILPKWFAFPADKLRQIKAKKGWVVLGTASTPDWPGFYDDIGVNLAPIPGGRSQPNWRAARTSGKLPDPTQVLSGSGKLLEPLVTGAGKSAILAAYVNDGGVHPDLEELAGTEDARLGDDEEIYPLVMVFEPDLMNNYGMSDRSRAMLALTLFDAVRNGQDIPIAFDLTLNGLGGTTNLLTLAFTPPFLAATLCLILAGIVIAWRAFRRFGPPLASQPPIAFGKRQLAVNGAALIQRAQRLHLLGAPYAALDSRPPGADAGYQTNRRCRPDRCRDRPPAGRARLARLRGERRGHARRPRRPGIVAASPRPETARKETRPMTMTLDGVREVAAAIRTEIAKAVVGQEQTVEHLLIALISQGHVLLEGPPGTAKTFLAQCFARTLGLDFGRIQFTPDLLPGDILGSNLFNFQTSQFTLTRGPVFCELLLADEINRTPPKTQAALLEAMQERKVTLDGETHALPGQFMVVATQNPIENQGVYPLPEAQLDRFLFKLLVPYPSAEEEAAIVARFGQRSGPPHPEDFGVAQVTDFGRSGANRTGAARRSHRGGSD